MKIRLHLVRFMYINLILSCCFWLYDNAAAADVPAINDAVAENANDAVNQEDARRQFPKAFSAAGAETKESVAVSSTKFKEKFTTAAAPAVDEGEISATAARTPTSTRQEADNIVMKLGIAPTTSENSLPAAVIDTSVKPNVLPSSVNINSNNQYDSVVPQSEKVNDAEEKEATANVPKNELNNKINANININTNIDVNQVDQLQQPNLGDGEKPTPAHEQQKVQQQQLEEEQQKKSLPDIITEQIPAVTVTELPVEVEHVKDRLDSVVSHEAPDSPSNATESQQQSQAFEIGEKEAQKAELNINDPGGGLELNLIGSSELNDILDVNVTGDGGQIENAAAHAGRNDTAEEVPMPVFSEWAQKQIEAEASREQAMELEQQVVNNSAQRRNATGSGSGKPPSLKLRAKNYASPDCGAKIIASNADATNTGAVLSHSSDEYMLSTCGSRIWFVVELCEAVQAQKVELANFELFSSSPKNFTVAVSKRFPTRDWSNVGRFAAEDKRTVQTFELHPHLFGKFVRVDIHSHYSKEHFCPISLFRVFGTSEFEAFETEIRHSDELDDFDDDFGGQEQPHKAFPGNSGGGANIFQSASDAVIQMVKKAAQVLVKPTKAPRWSTESEPCYTPTVGMYSCQGCNSSFVDRVNHLLSCQSQQIQLLLSLPQLRHHLLQTRVCQAEYNISFGIARQEVLSTCGMDRRQSFYLCILPAEHVGAMCKILQAESSSTAEHPVELPEAEAHQRNLDVAEQVKENETIAAPSKQSEPETKATAPIDSLPADPPSLELVATEMSSTEMPATDNRPAPKLTDSSTIAATPSDVNIFNVPIDPQKDPAAGSAPFVPDTSTSAPASPAAHNEVDAAKMTSSSPTNQQASASGESDNGDLVGSGSGLDDGNLANWESIDSLLTTTVASITAGGGAAAAAAAVVNGNANMGGTASAAGAGAAGSLNLQPKLTHGPQSESVFIRLSNRIKALERNMSLSGQYLEELSRRYKKQVEELQQTLTQQTLTVRSLEDQSRRYIEQEQLYQQQSAELAGEVRALTYQVQACILVIIIVGTCIFLMLVVGTVYYHKLRRQTQQLLPQTNTGLTKKKLCRRKSYEQMIEQSPEKQRRPSEEAMLILNGCGDTSLSEKIDIGNGSRQRKISVCYGSNNNIATQMFGTRAPLHRRKGAKNSWHSSLDSAQVSCVEHSDKFFDVDTLKSNKSQSKSSKKKSLQLFQQELKRQESAPGNYTQNCLAEEPVQSDFDESLILDDDDLCNFIPNSDLAYNEFMPDGPSGYQILDAVDGKSDKGQTAKKSRRVSSPAFFKSPFSKNKNKGGSINGIGGVRGSQSAHEATSWEWYRLRRSEKHSKQVTMPSVSLSQNASLDSSSLSEINFPFNSTQNSFRILGEAILSSGESRTNGKSSTVAAGSSSSSGASTTSSTTKKKQRTFNNIFRKVF